MPWPHQMPCLLCWRAALFCLVPLWVSHACRQDYGTAPLRTRSATPANKWQVDQGIAQTKQVSFPLMAEFKVRTRDV